ncbi:MULTISPECIES: hypothetical protein [Frankia]|nr:MULTISPECIES: hypothetical protein [Frankia]
MLLIYDNEGLRRLAVDAAFRPIEWEPDLVRSYRQKLQSLFAARDREDLRQVASLDLRAENGRDGTRCSIRLVNGSRLLLTFDDSKTDQVTVVAIVGSSMREAAS